VIPVAALVVIIVILVIAGLIAAGRTFRVVQQYEKGIVYRFGRVLPEVRGPGLTYLRPIGDRMQKVNMQIVAMTVPAQDGITRDNVSVRVDAVVYFRVVDPIKATVNVQDYMFAIGQQAQTSLRSIIGQSEMDQLLAERESVNRELRRIIDEPTEGPWGIRVERVEVKDVSLPEGMKRSMSRQAEAERERRARIITADGEYQASKRLAAAANVMARDPAALQLRLLQTMVEVAGERNSTLIMPVPVELLRFFEKMAPGPPQPVARPDEPEDVGDAEVAEAEAEISMANVPELDPAAVPQLDEAAVPPVPEVEPVPSVGAVPEAALLAAETPAADSPPAPRMPSPAETTQELPAATDFAAPDLPSGRNGAATGAGGPRRPRSTGERKARTPATRKPRTTGGAQANGEPTP
jgi:regulator of protease activity HflC (stomatin/prohibitin superfamily)